MSLEVASRNEFKLLNIKCQKYFDILSKTTSFARPISSDLEQKRLGFYFFMLESLCGVKDVGAISDFITDTQFNDFLTGQKYEDHGIDAIYIDHDKREIMLFNFKFREKFSIDKKQSLNDAFISTKLVNAILNEDTDGLKGKTKTLVDEVIAMLDSRDVWKLNLYLVSNESILLDTDESSIQQLKQYYDLEVIPFALPQIRNIMSIRPEPINAEIILDTDALMSYSESTISTSKSYIARLNAADIIRITCKNKELRNDYNLEKLESLATETLDYGVLFDNVRGFVQKSKYNESIAKSLKEEPSKFFMYNNGMTIVAKDIKAEEVNGRKKVRISINDFQVLNGGQTLRTLHNFNALDKDNVIESLSKSEVLVRIFNASDSESVSKIAEYTNSQNSISNIDLKSLSNLQIQIEQVLDADNIIYSRKNGDTGMDEQKDYRFKISMELFGQILFAIQGHPERSSNQKQHIFGKYYNEIFSEANFNILDAPSIVEKYHEVQDSFSKSPYSRSKIEQKVFYVMYIHKLYPTWSLQRCISELEVALNEFDADISDARKLIQVKFKEQFFDKLAQI